MSTKERITIPSKVIDVLTTPFDEDEIKAMTSDSKDKIVHGIVIIDLDTLCSNEYDNYGDYENDSIERILEKKLTDNRVRVEIIDFKAIGATDNGDVILDVKGTTKFNNYDCW